MCPSESRLISLRLSDISFTSQLIALSNKYTDLRRRRPIGHRNSAGPQQTITQPSRGEDQVEFYNEKAGTS